MAFLHHSFRNQRQLMQQFFSVLPNRCQGGEDHNGRISSLPTSLVASSISKAVPHFGNVSNTEPHGSTRNLMLDNNGRNCIYATIIFKVENELLIICRFGTMVIFEPCRFARSATELGPVTTLKASWGLSRLSGCPVNGETNPGKRKHCHKPTILSNCLRVVF